MEGLVIAVVSATVASGGFWWWLIASRRLNTDEYRALIEELRRERTDRGKEIDRLEIDMRAQERETRLLRLDLTSLESHVETLEGIIRRHGGEVPARPKRRSNGEPTG